MNTSDVVEIWRYPVKSLGGERIEQTTLDHLGVAGDRRWALRDSSTGKILSAKQPRHGSKLLACSARYLDPPSGNDPGVAEITIGSSTLRSSDPEGLNRAFSTLLGFDVRFVAATGADEIYESYWPEVEGLALSDVTTDFPIAMFTNKGTFGDLAALHVLSTTSIHHLRALIPGSSVGVSRFRPNIVAQSDDKPGFVENEWSGRAATLGDAGLMFGLSTPRCIMTTLEQPGYAADRSILTTLARENRIEFEGFGHFACLGAYAEVSASGGIAVGDKLTVASP
jgi:uncharacterized protein